MMNKEGSYYISRLHPFEKKLYDKGLLKLGYIDSTNKENPFLYASTEFTHILGELLDESTKRVDKNTVQLKPITLKIIEKAISLI